MSSSGPESGGGGVLDKAGAHVIETIKAVPGGLWDAIGRNIRERLKDTKGGISDVLGGTLVEPLRGLAKGAEELSGLHLGRAVLSIIEGVRRGISRIVKGVVDIGVHMPLKAAGSAGTGILRTAGGAALMGDIRNVMEGGEGAAAH